MKSLKSEMYRAMNNKKNVLIILRLINDKPEKVEKEIREDLYKFLAEQKPKWCKKNSTETTWTIVYSGKDEDAIEREIKSIIEIAEEKFEIDKIQFSFLISNENSPVFSEEESNEEEFLDLVNFKN